MNGLFGWAALSFADDEAASHLAAMSGAGVQAPGSHFEGLHAGQAALGVNRNPLPAAVARQGARLAAIHGRAVWLDEPLRDLARAQGDARALLEAHERWGDDTPARLGGTFALAVIDAASGDALLAIDRLGVRTLCVAERGGGLLFGSTADHLAAHPLAEPRLDLQAVFDYLYAHVIPSPGTIYAGVEKLLPAQRAVFRDGRLKRDFYWRMHYHQGRAGDEVELAREFRDLLERATRDALGDEAPQAVGTFLSGGTDSSTVAGMVTRVRGIPAETYSIGFDAEGFDEMEYARVAVRHFGLRPHEYYVTPADVVAAVPRIAATYDEPFGNASALPTLLCAERALGDGRTVLLAGDGGDELFGGNARYAKQKIFEWYWRLPTAVRAGLVEPLAQAVPTGAPSVLRKARSYVEQARIPLPRRLESYNLVERETPAVVFTPEFLRAVDTERPARLAAEAYARAGTSAPVDCMMHLDLKITLADADLRKVARMCELAGIEVRFPLLDERIVEFSGRLAPTQKVRGTQLRPFFKSALRDFLPPEIIRKSKHGFGLPFGPWMRTDRALEELALGSLEALRLRDWIRGGFLDALLDAHRTGHAAYYGTTIWVAMMLEQWLRSRRM